MLFSPSVCSLIFILSENKRLNMYLDLTICGICYYVILDVRDCKIGYELRKKEVLWWFL